jgi:hypothetical protein
MMQCTLAIINALRQNYVEGLLAAEALQVPLGDNPDPQLGR